MTNNSLETDEGPEPKKGAFSPSARGTGTRLWHRPSLNPPVNALAWLTTVSSCFSYLPATDRVVKFHHSVGNRSRDAFIFPRTTDHVVVFVVEGREYVVTILVSLNATPFEVKCLAHRSVVSQAADRHVMERAFAFQITGDPSEVSDCPRANSAIDFCLSVICIVRVVTRAASLRKLRETMSSSTPASSVESSE